MKTNEENSEKSSDKVLMKFLNDHLQSNDDGKVLVIRTGDAPNQLDQIKPNKVHIGGIISAPSEFFNKRATLHNLDKCHVIYDKWAGQLTLIVDEQFECDNYKITGKIIDNPDLLPFKINLFENGIFSIKELQKTLKFNRVHFLDKDENAKIVLSLQNFKAKVDKTIEESSDGRGNENNTKVTKLEHELQESFVLNMPIHKGCENYTFRVEIGLQVTSGGVVVWLESRELKELQITSKDAIISRELEQFKGIVCIEQ